MSTTSHTETSATTGVPQQVIDVGKVSALKSMTTPLPPAQGPNAVEQHNNLVPHQAGPSTVDHQAIIDKQAHAQSGTTKEKIVAGVKGLFTGGLGPDEREMPDPAEIERELKEAKRNA